MDTASRCESKQVGPFGPVSHFAFEHPTINVGGQNPCGPDARLQVYRRPRGSDSDFVKISPRAFDPSKPYDGADRFFNDH